MTRSEHVSIDLGEVFHLLHQRWHIKEVGEHFDADPDYLLLLLESRGWKFREGLLLGRVPQPREPVGPSGRYIGTPRTPWPTKEERQARLVWVPAPEKRAGGHWEYPDCPEGHGRLTYQRWRCQCDVCRTAWQEYCWYLRHGRTWEYWEEQS